MNSCKYTINNSSKESHKTQEKLVFDEVNKHIIGIKSEY